MAAKLCNSAKSLSSDPEVKISSSRRAGNRFSISNLVLLSMTDWSLPTTWLSYFPAWAQKSRGENSTGADKAISILSIEARHGFSLQAAMHGNTNVCKSHDSGALISCEVHGSFTHSRWLSSRSEDPFATT
jgi:hypothetical protein